MANLYGSAGFYWWVGVVEDRNDPLFLGRCRVRILGYHTENAVMLPTKDLPWAYPLQPITSAATSGIGQTPTGPIEGTWVTGFFRDGDSCQEPIMIGTMAGMPSQEDVLSQRRVSGLGFQDPNKKYPKDSYIENAEPDVNRLARNQKLSQTNVRRKDIARATNVPTAMNKTWSQSQVPYNAVYPYNHVYESESGHVIEIDDTPNNERISVYHKSGTYNEIDRNGTKTEHVVGDNYEVFFRNNNILIRGAANITVEGTCNIYVKNDCNLEVNGDLKTHVHGDYELNVGGKIEMYSGEDMKIKTEENLYVEASKNGDILAGITLDVMGESLTSIGSLVTEVGTLKAQSVIPSYLPAGTASPVEWDLSLPGIRETSEPVFPPLALPERRPEV